MRTSTFRCDVCGKEREESNHWFLASEGGQRELLVCGLTFLRWSDRGATLQGMLHLCGQRCAQRAQGRWMEAQRRVEERGEQ